MELPIMLLEDALRQQKEQLNDSLKRNQDKEAPAYEFREKAIANLKRFIAEIEAGINILTKVDKQEEALSIQLVSGSSPKDVIMHYDRLIKEKLPITFEELRDHGTHADFCNKINDSEQSKSILRWCGF